MKEHDRLVGGHSVIEYKENSHLTSFVLHKPTARYGDEFLNCKCSPDMILLKLFPNFKEITESFAAYSAVRQNLRRLVSFDDPEVKLVVVGDGSTPRTGATFAFRTNWDCISIDPVLRLDRPQWDSIRRLELIKKKVEDVTINEKKVVIVCVHSHAKLEAVLSSIHGQERHLVSLPCCVPQTIEDRKPDAEYSDWGIWSPQRLVRVWRNI